MTEYPSITYQKKRKKEMTEYPSLCFLDLLRFFELQILIFNTGSGTFHCIETISSVK